MLERTLWLVQFVLIDILVGAAICTAVILLTGTMKATSTLFTAFTITPMTYYLIKQGTHWSVPMAIIVALYLLICIGLYRSDEWVEKEILYWRLLHDK